MNIRMRLYQKLVNRIPAIQKRYHAIRQQKTGIWGRLYAWTALIAMNIYWILKAKLGKDTGNPDVGKRVPTIRSESSLSFRETPKDFAERLSLYDVISFDVFDTLIFRPFCNPTDLFFSVGDKLSYLDFERLRRQMEWRARQKKKERTGNYEVTLQDIYEEIEEQVGIPRGRGMKAEMDTELDLCFANPYMLEVFDYLLKENKQIICTSDMYLSSAFIMKLVEKCGFSGIKEYFISCEYGCSKGDGILFGYITQRLGRDKRYVHVGDHPVSDVKIAKKMGWKAELYRNVNIAGMPYRAEDMSAITGSIYRGLVNTHIHNGLYQYSREYELGFIYGGLFVLGYCRWIHEYVQTHNIDKILFLSRDGDILNQVYSILYPLESQEGKTEYVYWSRLAATKMSASYFKYDYFRRFIDHKVNQNYTLKRIFSSMEIEDMLDGMCEEFPVFMEHLIQSERTFGLDHAALINIHKECTISGDSLLTDQNAWMIKEYLISNWDEVLSHYKDQLKAGKLYYERVLKDCRHVVAVDIGWAGSGAISLDYIVNNIWNLKCEVTGLLAGTNSMFSAEPNMSETQLSSGKLVSFMFSQAINRDIWKFHDASKGHNLLWEVLLSSTQLSFKSFYSEDGKACVLFKGQKEKIPNVGIVQEGIRDFVRYWKGMEQNYNRDIIVTGVDVFHVVSLLLTRDNQGPLKEILTNFKLEVNVN